MKILIFSITYVPFWGGAEVAVKEITDRIPSIQFDMVTLRFDRSLPKFERVGNISVYRVGFTKQNPEMGDLKKWPLTLNKYLFPFTGSCRAGFLHKKNNYDAIWVIMANYAGFAGLLFKIKNPGVPYLLTLQEGDPIGYIKKRVRFVKPFFLRIFQKADFIQAISGHLANFAKEMGAKSEIAVVPNGVDIGHFSRPYSDDELEELKKRMGKQSDEKYIITVSRLVRKNAVDDVIKSLQFLPDKIKVLILGDGPDREKLKKLAADLKLNSRINFLGHIEHKNLPKYLKISDVFVRPSLSEGLGNSFLEAMAVQIPVIATRVGGIVDFLIDGKTGFFCELNNPSSIAEKVRLTLADQILRESVVNNAQELVKKNYDWDLIAQKMGKIFNKICVS